MSERVGGKQHRPEMTLIGGLCFSPEALRRSGSADAFGDEPITTLHRPADDSLLVAQHLKQRQPW